MLYQSGNLTVAHTVQTGFSMPADHSHDFYEIYCSQTEGVRFWVNDRVYPLRAGDMMIFNSADRHHAVVPEKTVYDRYVITFRPDFIRDWSLGGEDLLACFERRGAAFSHCAHLTEDGRAEFLSLLPAPAADYACLCEKISLARLLIFVNRLYAAPAGDRRGAELYARLRPAIDYIGGHLDEKLPPEALAARCYLSPYYFCRIFRRATGMTVNDYLSHRRMTAAVRLLSAGHSVSETARLVGFGCDTYFITKFRKCWGVPPKQFALHSRKKD
jgi:AraC-like DNA-binding protein